MSRRWYYAKFGVRYGPVSDHELKALAESGQLEPNDLIWTDGMTAWKPAVCVKGLFTVTPITPPPQSPTFPSAQPKTTGQQLLVSPSEEYRKISDQVADKHNYSSGRNKMSYLAHDIWAWLLVAVPVVGTIVELITGRSLLLLYLLLNSTFGFADERSLKANKYPAPSGWWAAIVVPVYLWKRGTVLQRPRLHFWLWVVSFIVSVVLTYSFDYSELEDTAQSLVTQIVREQLHGTAKCVRVRVTESLGNGYYKAVATLDNGNDLRVLIQKRGDMVYVTIPR
ncbi:MAG: DUF4339 domain-containing protein [Thermogemmata sp.]|nr:DUF4339 domain-containing protein [Thermogemmata sp.]